MMFSFCKKLGLFAIVLLGFGFALIFAGGFSGEAFAHTVTLSTSGTVNLEVSPAGVGNSNGASLGVDTLEVTSTCPLGYTVTISGPTDSTLYKNGESTNNATNQKITASTGTSTNPASILGDNLGTWGYALGVNPTTGESTNVTTSSNFIGLNGTNTTLITKSSASGDGDEVTTDTYPVYYGTSVSSAHEPGLYKLAESSEGAADNVITYYLTANANCNTYKIRYNDNGANSTTKMSDQNVNLSSDLTLWASNFKYPDSTNTYANSYGFAGWSLIQLDPNANDFKTKLTAAVNAGKVYGPNQTIAQADLQSFVDNNITVIDNNQYVVLYAIWVKSEGNIQAWQGCDSMNAGDITALKDTRDNNVYAIAKLADNKCWMIENLRLADKRSDNTPIILSNTNTNNPNLPLTNTWYTSSSVQTAKTTSNSLSASVIPSPSAPWCVDRNSDCFDQSMMSNDNVVMAISSMSQPTNVNVYSYGNYYNWYSATGGVGTYSVTGNNNNTVGSICPIGWHLPSAGMAYASSNTGTINVTGKPDTYREFYNLAYSIMGNEKTAYEDDARSGQSSYTSNTTNPNGDTAMMAFRKYPNNFLYSGIADNSSIGVRGSQNYYWSSTVSGNNGAYAMSSVSSQLSPGTVSYPKSYGLSIRCLASKPSYTVNFNANGGTGTMGAQIVPRDVATTLTTNAFTRTNYTFAGWNMAADGSGTSYTNGQSVMNIAPLFGTITLYAQWACPANRVCYDDNGANSSTKMSNQSISASATTIGLWLSNFQRAGYGFAGWSTEKLDADAADFQTKLTAAKNAGHVYGPMETITITAGQYSTLGLKLNAIWVPSAGNLQGWTGCSSLATGAVTALKDTRDNNVYAVAKLADNKCWMIENLRLDYTADITPANTQSTNNAFGGVFSGLAEPETDNVFIDSTAANSLYKSDGSGDIKGVNGATLSDIDTGNLPDIRFPRYRNDNTNSDSTINPNTTVANQTNNSSNIYSYGNYYSWAAAIADTGYYATTNQTVATSSICPTGWHLPSGGLAYASDNTGTVNVTGKPETYREFYNLGYKIMGSDKVAYEDTANNGYSYYSSNTTNTNGDTATLAFRRFPNNFLYSGYVDGSSVFNRGRFGYYWSSTAYVNSNAYDLYLNSYYVYPGTNGSSYKYYGLTIRCLAGS